MLAHNAGAAKKTTLGLLALVILAGSGFSLMLCERLSERHKKQARVEAVPEDA